METEIRHRLTALEERARETTAACTALAAIVASLPETTALDRARVTALIRDLAPDRSVEQRASTHAERILSAR